MPDRPRRPNSPLGMFFTVSCLPVTNTTTQAITSTTPVRMAVPKLESMPSMPILPRIEVKLAKTAERMA